ncbi:MAG: phosphopantothenoylcysteine decarboxylase [Alphaproteobacteria bacterium]
MLAGIASHRRRPALVIGFAAETEKLSERAGAKRLAKRADWVLANSVAAARCSAPGTTKCFSSPKAAKSSGSA